MHENKTEKNVIWLLFKVTKSITIPIESSLRDLFDDIVVDRFIFKITKSALTSLPLVMPHTQTGVEEISFYCEILFK